jgi:hypothetical protein
VVSWHGHFLVWGVTEKQLAKHLAKTKPRFTPIMPGLCLPTKSAFRLINSGTSFGIFSNHPVKNIQSASVESVTKKLGWSGLSKIPEKSDQGLGSSCFI